MNFEDLSPEFQEKARACKNEKELAELARTVGVELSDDELRVIVGGGPCIECMMDGASCKINAQCLSKTSPPPFECPQLAPCTENIGPIPVPQDWVKKNN